MDDQVKWRDRVSFAPFAEALGITTDSVMSARTTDKGKSWDVLYTLTPTAEPDEFIYASTLWVNEAGIMEFVRRRRISTIAEFHEQVKKLMDATAEGGAE